MNSVHLVCFDFSTAMMWYYLQIPKNSWKSFLSLKLTWSFLPKGSAGQTDGSKYVHLMSLLTEKKGLNKFFSLLSFPHLASPGIASPRLTSPFLSNHFLWFYCDSVCVAYLKYVATLWHNWIIYLSMRVERLSCRPLSYGTWWNTQTVSSSNVQNWVFNVSYSTFNLNRLIITYFLPSS